ncbi:helix-turn-helix domain-containing protein [Enterococcus faecalis]|uniref:helix-turn-helix domain-containing protein n=1 Tax=Enterococcus faecalis TaxID=1351 RepID=UPI003D10355C
MDKYIYNFITNNTTLRRVKLLLEVTQETLPVNIDTLAVRMNCTVKTIRNDLSLLQDALIPFIHFEMNKKYVTVSCFGADSLKKSMDVLLSNEPLFTIIQGLFDGVVIDFTDWSERLYLSETSCKKIFLVLEKKLNMYDLKLKRNPIQIVGAEEDIRLFFFFFFYHCRDVLSLKSPNKKHRQFTLIGEREAERYQEHFSVDYERLLYGVWIVAERICAGKTLKNTNYTDLSYPLPNAWHTFHDICQKNKHILNIMQFSMEDLSFLYAIFLKCIRLNYRKVKDQFPNLNVTRLLMKEYSLELEKIIQMKLDFYEECVLYESRFSKKFQKTDPELIAYVCNNYPDLFDLSLQVVRNCFEHTDANVYSLEDLATHIALILSLNRAKDKRMKLLLAFSGDSHYIEHIDSELKRIFSNNIQIISRLNPRNFEDIANLKIDICITNWKEIRLCSQSVDIIHTQRIPVAREWIQIYHYIMNKCLNNRGRITI